MKRLLSNFLLLFIIFSGSRAIIRALPGDPLETLIAESGTSIPASTLREELNLDQPFFPALWVDLRRAVAGDFGRSLLSKLPVFPTVTQRFFRTLQLAIFAFLIGLPLSLGLGLFAAAHEGGMTDRCCSALGALTAAFPIPWIGPILILFFSIWIPIFPLGGHIVLPALTLALSISGLWARLIRGRVREAMSSTAVAAARARGIPEWKVIAKYGLAPVSGALAGFFGTQLGGLMAGAFVTEVIFDWRGLGSLLVESVLKRDYPLVEAAVFFSAAASILGSFLGDLAQSYIDPRLSTKNL